MKQNKLNRSLSRNLVATSERILAEGNLRSHGSSKASKKERNAGCETLPDKEWKLQGLSGSVAEDGVSNKNGTGTVRGVSKNNHPTVKPQALMSYLVNLVTPPGGAVLDPFMGSGSTGVSAINNDFSFVGVEMDEDYLEIASHRINNL